MNMDAVLHSTAASPDAPLVAPEPSILAEYVFFPLYDCIVTYYPKSWYPNQVTLVGVAATLVSSLLMLAALPVGTVFIPDHAVLLPASLTIPDPSVLRDGALGPVYSNRLIWGVLSPVLLYIICGTLNLVYCIADNTDGRLARRDLKTSLIGEYLDHGLDCVTSLLSASVVFIVLGGSLSNMSVAVCLIAFVTALSHTLHFETGIFIWGNRVLSVDEAMVFFALGIWLPVLFPSWIAQQLPEDVLRLVMSDSNAAYLSRMKVLELVYVAYGIAQVQATANIVMHRWQMLGRLHILFSALNGVILLGLQSFHNNQVITSQPATPVWGYTFGPFMYPALWVITCACTSSTIVHIPIFSRCARLSRTDPLPLAGILFVWLVFVSCPAAGAALAVLLHTTQITLNILIIKRRARRGKALAVHG